MPSKLLAIADSRGDMFDLVHPYPEPPEHPIRGLGQIHNAGANAVFCDGHVEYKKFRQWTEASAPARRRWNNDHEPHPETW